MIAEQLKKSILQAAIQGKLTEQLPEDGNARDLLKEIQKEKARLIREGKIKKEKQLTEITDDEIPFEIPENWRWVKLADIAKFIDYRGKTPKKTTSGVRLITAKNVKDGYISIIPEEFINPNDYDKWMTRGIPCKGDILFTTEAPLGNVAIIDTEERFALAQRIIAFQLLGKTVNKFLMYYLKSSGTQKLLREKSTGTTVLGIKASKLKEIQIAMPPVIEQERIGERLDDLLTEIDKLKNDETRLEELQKSFPKKMKDAILQYAIQGKLTEQLPEDGDARDLLKEIQKEKARLIKEGKIKKEKPLPEITEDEIPFEIPENWCWVRLGEIIDLKSGQDMAPDNYNSINKGIPYITGASCFSNEILFIDRWTEVPRSVANEGDLLITCKGTVGEMACLKEEKAHIARQVMAIRSIDCSGLDYILIFLKWYVSELKSMAKSMIPGISREMVLNALLPLPPTKEQERIVERIEALLSLCKALE